MMGRQTGDQSQLFYLFNLEGRVPAGHLLRRINPMVTRVLSDLREKLAPLTARLAGLRSTLSLMIRMLLVGYCYGIRFERRLCEEVELHLAYRWFCRLDLDDQVPDHSSFPVNRHGRFRDSDILRHVFEFGGACVHGRGPDQGRGLRCRCERHGGGRQIYKDDRHGAGCILQRCQSRSAANQDDIRRQRNQFGAISAIALGVARAPRNFSISG